MKLKIWIVILSFLTVINLTAVAAILVHHVDFRPQGDELREPEDRSRFMERGRHRLPREERKRFMELFHEFRDDTEDLRERTTMLENEIVDLMRQDPVAREALDSLLVEVSALRLEISRKATDRMLEAKEFLTPEQQEMFYRAILRGRPGDGSRGRHFRPRG